MTLAPLSSACESTLFNLSGLLSLVQGLAGAMGQTCNFTVYCLAERAAYAHAGDELLAVQANLPRQIQTILDDNPDPGQSPYLYRTNYPDGQSVNHTVVFVYNSEGKLWGCCDCAVNISPLLQCRASIDLLLERAGALPGPACESAAGQERETLRAEMTVLGSNGFTVEKLGALIADCLNDTGVAPAQMTNYDRMRVVERLEQTAAFSIKGAVEAVATALGVTRYTIYYYLKKLRR